MTSQQFPPLRRANSSGNRRVIKIPPEFVDKLDVTKFSAAAPQPVYTPSMDRPKFLKQSTWPQDSKSSLADLAPSSTINQPSRKRGASSITEDSENRSKRAASPLLDSERQYSRGPVPKRVKYTTPMSPPHTPFNPIKQNQMPLVSPSSERSALGISLPVSPPITPFITHTSRVERPADRTTKSPPPYGTRLSTALSPKSEKPSRHWPILGVVTAVPSDKSASPISRAISQSPNPSELISDPFKIVDEFRVWLIKKSATVLHERLHKAFEKIKEGDWMLEHLPTFTKEEWQDLDIKPSTGKTLVMAVAEFHTYKQKMKEKGKT
jgi:hypothetical protein